jgi:cytochrome c oxidase assembly protein subunit 15
LAEPLRSAYRKLILFSAALAFVIVVLGAYVRLTDAGLGCPDWPGCYGYIAVPKTPQEIARAQQDFPGKVLEPRKSWIEMVHRYFASSLGLLILIIAFMAWSKRSEFKQSPVLALLLVAVVILQGMLGMWTVTLLLKPVIVTLHLLGGLTTLALLLWLALGQFVGNSSTGIIASSGLRRFAAIALIVLSVQIALGGWVSTNYAALACGDFPTCHGSWLPGDMDFGNAFHVLRELGQTPQGELLSLQALTAIHWAHRAGALVVALVVGTLALRLLALPAWRRMGALVLTVLAIQISLGIANVRFNLPLSLAVAHNAVAALLLAILVTAIYLLHRDATREL